MDNPIIYTILTVCAFLIVIIVATYSLIIIKLKRQLEDADLQIKLLKATVRISSEVSNSAINSLKKSIRFRNFVKSNGMLIKAHTDWLSSNFPDAEAEMEIIKVLKNILYYKEDDNG